MLSANVTFLALRLSSLSSSSTLSSESSVSSVSVLSSSSFMLSPFVSPAVLKSSSDSRRLSFLSCSTLRTFSSFLSVYGSSVSRLDIVRGDFVSSLSSVIQIRSDGQIRRISHSTGYIRDQLSFSSSVCIHQCSFIDVSKVCLSLNSDSSRFVVLQCVFERSLIGIKIRSNTCYVSRCCFFENYATSNSAMDISTSYNTTVTHSSSKECVSSDPVTGDDHNVFYTAFRTLSHYNTTGVVTRDSTLCMLFTITTEASIRFIHAEQTRGYRVIELYSSSASAAIEQCQFINNTCSVAIISVNFNAHLSSAVFFGNNRTIVAPANPNIVINDVLADTSSSLPGISLTLSTTLLFGELNVEQGCFYTFFFSSAPHSRPILPFLSIVRLIFE